MQKVLIVEDEPSIVDTIRYALQTEGFLVTSCPTGREALAILAGGGIDLIILDIGLPDCSGFSLCKDLRKTSMVPVIFLTARAEEVDRIVGLEIGADDYIVKPFSPRELSARVRAVLRRTAGATGEGGAASGKSTLFAIDEHRLVISYSGQPLALSRYEYRILKTLIERPGWVFSRDQLMEHAWEEPETSLDRTVDTHIKTIRAKLRAVKPGIDPIRTHRGRGYSLRESS